MPHSIRARRIRALAACVLAVAGAAVLAPIAQGACPTSLSSPMFAQFGDQAAYSLAPGGSFESGTPGWSLSNSAVVEGNESYNLVPGSHSLQIGPNGAALSPWICISSEYPSFRLFSRRVGGNGPLNVSLQWLNLLGLGVNTSVAWLHGSGPWAPSPPLKLGSAVPLWTGGSSLQVRLSFQSMWTSSWAIDDVFIDPYSRR